jgi:hypothetical protein
MTDIKNEEQVKVPIVVGQELYYSRSIQGKGVEAKSVVVTKIGKKYFMMIMFG